MFNQGWLVCVIEVLVWSCASKRLRSIGRSKQERYKRRERERERDNKREKKKNKEKGRNSEEED